MFYLFIHVCIHGYAAHVHSFRLYQPCGLAAVSRGICQETQQLVMVSQYSSQYLDEAHRAAESCTVLSLYQVPLKECLCPAGKVHLLLHCYKIFLSHAHHTNTYPNPS